MATRSNPKDTEEFVKSMGECDFYIGFLNDKKVGCGCFRTKTALIKWLREHDNTGEKVDVLACDWDD